MKDVDADFIALFVACNLSFIDEANALGHFQNNGSLLPSETLSETFARTRRRSLQVLSISSTDDDVVSLSHSASTFAVQYKKLCLCMQRDQAKRLSVEILQLYETPHLKKTAIDK